MKKALVKVLSLVVAALLVLTGCGKTPAPGAESQPPQQSAANPGTPSPSPNAKTVLNLTTSGDPNTLNPYKVHTTQNARVYRNILEGLFILDETETPVPLLVESYEMLPGNMGVVVKLHKGVLFHNGEEMKASDVVYTFECFRNSPDVQLAAYFDWDKIEALDEYTVKIPTTSVIGPILLGLTRIYVVNEKAMKESGDRVGQEMVGTGPYMLDKWVSGDSLTLKRFDNYWGGAKSLSSITYKIISEASVAMIELETGGADLVLDTLGSDIRRVEGDAKSPYQVIYSAGTLNNYLGFNCSKAPFDNVKVRQAVCYAIDRSAIVTAVYENMGAPANSIVPNGAWGYDTKYDTQYPYEFNPGKAKELLAEAGYAGGLTINLVLDDQAYRVATSELLINMLANVGITLTVDSYDFATCTDILTNTNDYNVFLRSYDGMGDPGSVIRTRFGPSNGVIGGSNLTKTSGIPEAEKFGSLIDQALSTVDSNQRKELYRQAQEVFMANMFAMPLQTNRTAVIAKGNLRGFSFSGSYPNLGNVYFE